MAFATCLQVAEQLSSMLANEEAAVGRERRWQVLAACMSSWAFELQKGEITCSTSGKQPRSSIRFHMLAVSFEFIAFCGWHSARQASGCDSHSG